MRRRGFRGRSGGSARLGDRLREIRELGLRELRSLNQAPATPPGIELASGQIGGGGRALVVAGRETGLELIAWARLALALEDSSAIDELVIAAPSFDGVTRRAAQQLAAERIPVRLVSVAALADQADKARSVESFPSSHEGPAPGSLLDRVVRVIDGAVTVTGAGALRRFGSTHLVYLRGVCVLNVAPEGDGVVVQFVAPESRQVHVTDANFPRWGPELHESVVGLAQDPRLLERPEGAQDAAATRAADAAGVRIVARWIPRDATGSGAAAWLGQDAQGVPVVGMVQRRVGVKELAGLIAGIEAVREHLPHWLPAAPRAPRLLLVTEALDSAAQELLAKLGIAVETRELDQAVTQDGAPSEERRGRRRRPRRRGRRSEDERASEDSGAPDDDVAAAETPSEQGSGDRRRRSRRRGGRRPSPEETPEVAALVDADETPEPAAEGLDREEADRRARVERRRARRGRRQSEPGVEEVADEIASSAPAEDGAATDPAASPEEPVVEAPAASAELELEADDSEAKPDAPEEPPVEKPQRRRARASICVRDDQDAILSALTLARDRRHIPFFYVCSQADLMDFFRGKATDLEESSDLLMVGFSADPIPRETIAMAELFRGRIQWYDSGNWAIEDIEALRSAIGEDSVAIDHTASSPLAPVLESCERRSRFTDKLVDLAARRLSENEMQRWGYRLMGLIGKMIDVKGDQRTAVSPVLAGKPAEIPEVAPVYEREAEWLEEHDPRMVHFGEYQMAVVHVPEQLDASEIGRRARLRTGARLSLACRENDNLVILGSNDEKRYINLTGVVDEVSSDLAWARPRNGGDRIGRFQLEGLVEHPERLDTVIGAIAQHKSVLYG